MEGPKNSSAALMEKKFQRRLNFGTKSKEIPKKVGKTPPEIIEQLRDKLKFRFKKKVKIKY
ncbi:hypothetical protein BpHYR1_029956 [Brachionus plicatilis]|uniref:Uncharacterized protein n=1 Tax=Brachionus plicatilis TaxID=10195 RepID=A0A3M7QCX8_BRAPC|nr:hypothetical protein BpHYR1_029956 [Brachionus plicatilis]